MTWVAESGSVMDGHRVSGPATPPGDVAYRSRTGRTVSHRTLLTLLLAAAMLVGLAVAAPQAEAATLYTCPAGTPWAYTCTRVNATVTVYDRIDHVNRTWYLGTSVGLMYYSWDFSGKCGSHGDGYVWSVSWWGGGHAHWAVIGYTWLQTGADTEWGPHVADPYGNPFNPTFQLIAPNGTQSYCNAAYWSFMSGRI